MITEYQEVRQIENEPKRRWFGDQFFDLIVWQSETDKIVGFQLCYSKGSGEHALTWEIDSGFEHRRVDDGESGDNLRKCTPVLTPDGTFDHEIISVRFRDASAEIDPIVANFVHSKLIRFSKT